MSEPWNLTEPQRRQFREAQAEAKRQRAASLPDVKPGQVWADNDWRCEGRTLRVERIEGGKAVCTVLTNMTKAQVSIDAAAGKPGYYADFKDMRGKTTRISLSRFRPTSTGYRLMEPGQENQG